MATSAQRRRARLAKSKRLKARIKKRTTKIVAKSGATVVTPMPFADVPTKNRTVEQLDKQIFWLGKSLDKEAETGFKGKSSKIYLQQRSLQILRDTKGAKPTSEETLTSIGLQVGAVTAGLAGGTALAHGLEKRYVSSMVATNLELSNLATNANMLTRTKKGHLKSLKRNAALEIKAIAKQAAKVTRPVATGKLGLVLAGGFAADAAYSHFIGRKKAQTKAGKQAVDTWTATNIIGSVASTGHSLISGGTSKTQLDRSSLSVIEGAVKRADDVLQKATFKSRVQKTLGDRIVSRLAGKSVATTSVKIAKPVELKGAALKLKVQELRAAGHNIPTKTDGKLTTANRLRHEVAKIESKSVAKQASKTAQKTIARMSRSKLGLAIAFGAGVTMWLKGTKPLVAKPITRVGTQRTVKRLRKNADGKWSKTAMTDKQARAYRAQRNK